MPINFEARENTKLRKTDRVLVLEEIPGEKVRSYKGVVDNRIFKGGNRLRAVQDPSTCFWHLKYDIGEVPEPLRGSYSRFNYALNAAKIYFDKRGLQIKEVID